MRINVGATATERDGRGHARKRERVIGGNTILSGDGDGDDGCGGDVGGKRTGGRKFERRDNFN